MTLFATEHITGFGGTHFGILWGNDPMSMPGWQQGSFAETKHVPGSDVNITQLLGLGEAAATYRLFFEDKREFNAFMALRQTTGTLTLFAAMCEFDVPQWETVYFGKTYIDIPDVLLFTTSDERPGVDGTVEVTATFQLQERPS